MHTSMFGIRALLLALFLALAGCGGSSDGGNDATAVTGGASPDGTDASVDTGNNTGGNSETSTDSSSGQIKTVQATVTTSNAEQLGVATARGIKKALLDKDSNPSVPSINPGASGIQFLPLGVETLDMSFELCEYGMASMTFSDDYLSFDMSFEECYFEGALMDGYMLYSSSEDGLQSSFEMELYEYYDYEGEEYSYAAKGHEIWSPDFDSVVTYYEYLEVYDWVYDESWTLYDHIETCTGLNSGEPVCTFQDDWEEDGETYRIEDAAVAGDETSGFDVEAKIYDDDNGFIEIDTTSNVLANCTGKNVGSGSALFKGAEGSTGEIQFNSCDSFTITVDGVSQTFNWSDL